MVERPLKEGPCKNPASNSTAVLSEPRPMPQQRNLSRYFFIAILVAATVLFFAVIRPFLIPVLLAAVFCTLFYPLFEFLLRLFRQRRFPAALLSCVLLLLGLLLPMYFVADMVAREGVEFYNSAETEIKAFFSPGESGAFARIERASWYRSLGLQRFDWQASAQDAAKSVGSILGNVIKTTSSSTLHAVVVLFTTLFTMFYFFRDGDRLIARLKYLVPLPAQYEDRIVQRFASVARATVKGTLLIALVQGTLSGLTLWACGVGSPILWGVVAVLLSIIPLVGAWLVLYPAAAIQILLGNVIEGVVILVVTMVVIVNVDNLLRPRLVGQEAGMHDLMVFFSTLGGIGLFGAMGFIVGPVVAAFFLSVLDIYATEYKDDLDRLVPDKGAPEAAEGGA